LSTLLTAVMEGRATFATPGDYVVHWLYPSSEPRPPLEFAEVLWVMLGTDFIIIFASLSAVFIVISRLLKSRETSR
jgi:hypothetical protein